MHYLTLLFFFLCINQFVTVTTSSNSQSKYLSYTPYWGLSNQMQELNVAMNWAHFLNRTLILPKYFQSRSTPSASEPTYQKCLAVSDHPNCEPVTNLIDIDRLQQYLDVVLEEEYNEKYNDATTSDTDDISLFVIDFGIDFSIRSNRTKYLIRWMEDLDRNVLHSYTTLSTPATSATTRTQSHWCQKGIQLGPFRCQRSAQELVDVTSKVIHFPAFTTFTVGKIWSSNLKQRDLLNKASNNYVGPSKHVLTVARQVLEETIGIPYKYNAVHIRLGDFLTETWAKSLVKSNKERATILFNIVKESNLPLYIATNDDQHLPNILQAYIEAGFKHVVTWPMHQNASVLTRSMAEQNILIGAEHFDSQKGSTYSGYVDLVRSNADIMQFHGYNAMLTDL